MIFCEPSVTKKEKVKVIPLVKNLPLDNVPHVMTEEVPPVSCFDLTKKEFSRKEVLADNILQIFFNI
jgi:hypothetical protein